MIKSCRDEGNMTYLMDHLYEFYLLFVIFVDSHFVLKFEFTWFFICSIHDSSTIIAKMYIYLQVPYVQWCVCHSICLPVCLSICLSVSFCLSACLYSWLSVYPGHNIRLKNYLGASLLVLVHKKYFYICQYYQSRSNNITVGTLF